MISTGRYCEVLMESFEIISMPWFDFAKGCLRLRQGLAKDVNSYACRLGNFNIEIRLQTSPVGTREDRSPLNTNAKVFKQKPTECVKTLVLVLVLVLIKDLLFIKRMLATWHPYTRASFLCQWL